MDYYTETLKSIIAKGHETHLFRMGQINELAIHKRKTWIANKYKEDVQKNINKDDKSLHSLDWPKLDI